MSRGAIFKRIIDLLRTRNPPKPSPKPKPDCSGKCPPPKTKEREQELGYDPAKKKFSQSEADSAFEIEKQQGVTLRRSPHEGADFIDDAGRTYDLVGPVPTQHFNSTSFSKSVLDHVSNKSGINFVPINGSGLSQSQIQSINNFISTLSPGQQSKIIRIGF